MNRSIGFAMKLMMIWALALMGLIWVHGASAGGISGDQAKERVEILQKIFSSADRFETMDKGYVRCDVAYKGAERIGGAFYTEGRGYGGSMQVMVGIDSRGKVLEVLLLSHQETLGLWTKQADQEFRAQFRGKNGPFILRRDNAEGNLDGVTSATVTCRAIMGAVEEALQAFKKEWGTK